MNKVFTIRIIFFYFFCVLCNGLIGQSLSVVFPKESQSVDTLVQLNWNKGDSSNTYRLLLNDNNTFSNPLISRVVNTPSFDTVLPIGSYFWKVLELKNNIAIDSSSVNTFQVFIPSQLDSLDLWIKSDTGLVFSTGNDVLVWEDQSGNNSDLVQFATFRQATREDSVLNNYPSVRFDNRFDRYPLTNSLNTRNYSIAMVYNHKGTSSSRRILFSSSQLYFGIAGGQHTLIDGLGLFGKPVVQDEFVVHHCHSSDDTLRNVVNGILIDQKLSVNTPGGNMRLGEDTPNGDFMELVIYDGEITKEERISIDNYLMDKYAPPINLGSDQEICSFPYTIDAARDYIKSYSWSNGSSDSAINVNASGKYYLTVTDMFNRVSTDSIVIFKDTVNFQVDLPTSATICVGDSLTINAGDELYSYVWSTGATTNEITIKTPQLYKVSVTNCNAVVSEDSILLVVNNPQFSLESDTSICFLDTISLLPDTAISGTYNWSTNVTDTFLTVFQTGLYALTITDQANCVFSDSINVQVDSSLFGIDLGPDLSLCAGNEIGLLQPLPNADSYLWNTGATDSVITITTAQKYYLTVTQGTCSNTDSIDISLKGLAPVAGFSTSSLCFGDSLNFRDTSFDINGVTLNRWKWYFGDGDSSTNQNPRYFYAADGVYQVELEIENDSGCIGTEVKNIRVFPKPEANFSTGLKCETDSVAFLDGSSISFGLISSYLWDFGDPSTNQDTAIVMNPFYTYAAAGSYTVRLELESDQNCRDTIVKTVGINPVPQVDFNFTGLYSDDSIRFSNLSTIASGNIASYNWDFDNSTNSAVINPVVFYGQTGRYGVSLGAQSDSGCTNNVIDTVVITKRPPPRPEFNTVYPKQGQFLSEQFLFSWNESSLGNSYELQIASDIGFQNLLETRISAKRSVQINTLPSGQKYWRVLAKTNGNNVDTTNIAEFTVFYADELDSLSVWTKADTGIVLATGTEVSAWQDLSGNSHDLSQLQTFRYADIEDSVLNGYPALRFDNNLDRYDFQQGVNSKNYSFSIVYNHVGTSSSRRLIYANPSWQIGLIAAQHTAIDGTGLFGKPLVREQFVVQTCHSFGDTLRNFVNGIEYDKKQATNAPGASLRLSEDALNGYIAELVVFEGAVSPQIREQVDNYLMDKYAPPINLGQDSIVCGFPIQLDMYKDYILDYQWSTGATDSAIQIDSAGKYYLTITDMFERTSIDSIFFVLDSSTYAVQFEVDDTTICEGTSIDLIAGRSVYKYQWNTLDTNFSIAVDSSALYKVTVENCRGDLSTDSIEVIVNNPVFDLGIDTTICHNGIISIQSDSSFSNVSYLWSTGENTPSIQTDTAENYLLTVTDNFNCSYTDSIQINIDSTMFGLTLGPDTSLCEGNLLALQNPNANITSYMWTTGNNTSAQLIDTAGIYSVRVGNGRCFVEDTAVISIKGLAPRADFSTANFCFNDSVVFTDLSSARMGDTLVDWRWDFGDGTDGGDSIQNTIHQYATVADFSVLLTVTTDKGCSDTLTRVVTIDPKPEAKFAFQNQVSCSKNIVEFYDSSTVTSGTINAFSWDFGDPSSTQDTSILQNGAYIYDTLGTYNITFIVESDQGCRDTVSQLKYINPSPNVGYSYEGTCLGDSTQFFDETVLPAGSIQDYLWRINREDKLEQNPSVKYTTAGKKGVVIRVRTVEGCTTVLRDSIEIFNTPIASYTVENICEGIPFSVTNTSVSLDSVQSYRYIYNNVDTTFVENPTFTESVVANYPLSLKVTTIHGCSDSTASILVINPKPQANFTILNNNTGIPFEIALENNSTNADLYTWVFGNGDSSSMEVPVYTYQDTGKYNLKLIVSSAAGCLDSTEQEVISRTYFLDALLNKIFLTENPLGDISVSAEVINSGFNTIKQIRLIADLNNQFQFRETFDEVIFSGRSRGFEFGSSFIQDKGSKVDFVCVRIETVNGLNDSIASNNEICERAFNNKLSINLYPSPADQYINMEYVLPEEGNLVIRFFDQMGRSVLKEFNRFSAEGFYTSIVNVSSLRPGLYHYQFVHNGTKRQGTFLKK